MSGSLSDDRILEAVSDGNFAQIEGIVRSMGTTIKGYRSSNGSTLLHITVMRGTVSLAQTLIDHGVDVNVQRTDDGVTALHLATIAGRLSIVEAILARPEVDDTIKDASGRTALQFARTKPIETAFEYAQNQFVSSAASSIHAAVQKGDVAQLLQLMQNNRIRELCDVNTPDKTSGDTILHRAVKTGNVEMVDVCLKLGVDPFAKNRKGKMAIELSSSEELRTLLREGKRKDNQFLLIFPLAPMVGSPPLNDTMNRLSGYLLKYVNFASGYKRRYVVLEDGVLSYYKSKEDYPISCKGNLNVQFARLVVPPGDRLSFELRTAKYSLYFRADNEADAGRWTMALGRWQNHISSQNTFMADDEQGSKAANRLHQRSQSSMVGLTEYSQTLRAAQECLRQLKTTVHGHLFSSANQQPPASELLANQRRVSDSNTISQSGSGSGDPVCVQLLQSLQEFFRLCEEREGYWQGRLDAEIRQRAMVEESLRKVIKQRVELDACLSSLTASSEGPRKAEAQLLSSSDRGGSISSSPGEEEFYDAMEEAENLAALSISDSLEGTEGLGLPSTLPGRSPSAEKLEELRVEERAIPGEEINFVLDQLEGYQKLRRNNIPVKSTKLPPISIWNIIKNAIGKDLTKIPVPVNFSEPLSMLQRFCEDLEYADLLYLASTSEDPLMRLQYVAAFAVSPYSSSDGRLSKPFNPLLGETFEYTSAEHGFRYIAEQVSHHPPVSACYCESARFIYYAEVAVKTKFWKSLELIPDGLNHVILKGWGEHYSYRKVNTAVYNLIMGKMWVDHYGTLRVTNHNTGDYVDLEFKPTGWRTADPRRLEGMAYDCQGIPRYRLEGYWHRYLQTQRLATDDNDDYSYKKEGGGEEDDKDGGGGGGGGGEGENKDNNKNKQLIELWRRRPIPPWSGEMYNFTYFTPTLNELTPELEKYIAPTDSRLRPDQRAMEEGRFDAANELKVALEEKQRTRRKAMEAQGLMHCPRWFVREIEPDTKEPYWKYLGGYWEARKALSWPGTLDIYLSDSESVTTSSELATATFSSITTSNITATLAPMESSQSDTVRPGVSTLQSLNDYDDENDAY